MVPPLLADKQLTLKEDYYLLSFHNEKQFRQSLLRLVSVWSSEVHSLASLLTDSQHHQLSLESPAITPLHQRHFI